MQLSPRMLLPCWELMEQLPHQAPPLGTVSWRLPATFLPSSLGRSSLHHRLTVQSFVSHTSEWNVHIFLHHQEQTQIHSDLKAISNQFKHLSSRKVWSRFLISSKSWADFISLCIIFMVLLSLDICSLLSSDYFLFLNSCAKKNLAKANISYNLFHLTQYIQESVSILLK